MTELTKDDLVVGGLYRAKRPRRGWNGEYNDRVILWIGLGGREIQYDSYAVAQGHHFPKVTAEKFLKWAKERIHE